MWDNGKNAEVTSASIAKWLDEGLDNSQPSFIGNQNGDAKAALAGAVKKVEAVYNYPYQNHATMEPLNATAALYRRQMRGLVRHPETAKPPTRQCWKSPACPLTNATCTRSCSAAVSAGAGQTDYVRQAVSIAKQMPGIPVKLLWSREEDMQHGNYHPITHCKMTGAFDADNNLTGLHMRISGQSILFALRPEALVNGMDPATFQGIGQGGEAAFGYTVPNLLIEHCMRNPHVPPGFWRGVNVNHNAIYVECFMDELAHSVGQDPVAFRRKPVGKAPQEPRRAQRRGGKDRLGQAGAARRLSRRRPAHGFRQLRRRRCRDLGVRGQQDQGASHRRRHRSRLCGQSGADRTAGCRLVRLRG